MSSEILRIAIQNPSWRYYRTSLCRFSKGSCWFGNFCFYAHDKTQMRSGPDDPKGMPGTEAFDFDLAGQTAMEEALAAGACA